MLSGGSSPEGRGFESHTVSVCLCAAVVELEDTPDLGSGDSNVVHVRLMSAAPLFYRLLDEGVQFNIFL